jgi:hypothetical protein
METERPRKYGRLILFLAIAALFIYTNPDEKMHLDFVRRLLHREIEKKPSTTGGLVLAYELILGEQRFNNLMKDKLRVKNYIFFSLTEAQVTDQKEIIAIGLLGNIYSMEDVKNEFDSFRIKYNR